MVACSDDIFEKECNSFLIMLQLRFYFFNIVIFFRNLFLGWVILSSVIFLDVIIKHVYACNFIEYVMFLLC